MRKLVILTAILSSALTVACIFDKGGDYKGGGRRPQGFEEVKQDAGAEQEQDLDAGSSSGFPDLDGAFGG